MSVIGMNAQVSDNPDTLVVARDGTGQFRNIDEALEVCRAFMEYHKVIYVKKGVYKEKLILPSWKFSPIISVPQNADTRKSFLCGSSSSGGRQAKESAFSSQNDHTLVTFGRYTVFTV